MDRTFLRIVLMTICATFASVLLSANHSWGGFHWARTSNPFTLDLAVNIASSSWQSHLVKTSSDWSLSSVLDTTLVHGATNPASCTPTSGRVEVCVDFYGNTGWLGIAQVWLQGLHIVQGVVKINDTYFHQAQYNTNAWRHFVMCQEVGHTLGLDHQDEDFGNANLGTCMDYTDDPDGSIGGQLNNVSPNEHDYEQLDIIYAHLDSTTTVGSLRAARELPPAMRDIDFAARGQWGRLLKRTNNGRAAIYELDFGRGFKVHTFVIFA